MEYQAVAPIRSPDSAVSMVEVLQMRAATAPERERFLFLIDGEEEGPRLTYAELDRQARTIAATIQEVAEPGDRAVLVFPYGLEFVPAFFGCLYAGVIAVPAYPPRLDLRAQSWQLLLNIIRDCQPKLVLTCAETAESITKGLARIPEFSSIRCIVTDALDHSAAHRWREPATKSDDVAFLQYTSGSTAFPKGVMISHRNLLHNERMLQTATEHNGTGVGVSWLPLYHDFGLVAGVVQAVYDDSGCILMSPLSMLQRPFRWLQAVSKYRAITSGGPSFGFDLCVERITPEQRATLDLSSWTRAGMGSEPIRASSIARFCETFEKCGFRPEAIYPGYGLAEATMFVTGGSIRDLPKSCTVEASALERGQAIETSAASKEARTFVGCGHTFLDQRLVIADPDTQVELPELTVGEIWISGSSVGQGYWNRPNETRQTFHAYLRDKEDGPFLRTGDLGFVKEGQLYVTGRIKDLIKIHGRNHYPNDVEATVQSVHPSLRVGCGAAFEIEREGKPALVIVQEVDRRCRSLDHVKLIGDIRQAISEQHALHVHDVQFLKSGSIPKTSSGKIQRFACRLGYENGTLPSWKEKEA